MLISRPRVSSTSESESSHITASGIRIITHNNGIFGSLAAMWLSMISVYGECRLCRVCAVVRTLRIVVDCVGTDKVIRMI